MSINEKTREYQRAWRKQNAARRKANARAWYKEHQEEQKERARANYSQNRDKALADERKRRENNPARTMFVAARSRAKKAALAFDIEQTDVVIPALCPVFGIPLTPGVGRRTDSTPTLDRIDNAKGYVKGNVRVISWRANRLKGRATVDEIRKLLGYMTGE